MSKPGKKAELDKDGIKLPENTAKDGKGKVELDKDGIALAKQGKADLDKDGIPLAQKQTTDKDLPAEAEEGAAAVAVPSTKRTKLIIAAVAVTVVLLVSLSVGGYLWHKGSQKPPAPLAQSQAPKAPVILNEGAISLDPFMVMYTPQKPGKAGLLVAEVVLTVNPKTSANVRDRLYEIRSLINDNLAKNVEVYTQFEITEMLKEGLRPFDVSDVTFARYDLK